MKTGSESGQAAIELLLSAFAAILTFAGVGAVLRGEWQRLHCAHLVFERTHERLIGGGGIRLPDRIRVSIREDAISVTGEARCGRASESVTLYKLEPER